MRIQRTLSSVIVRSRCIFFVGMSADDIRCPYHVDVLVRLKLITPLKQKTKIYGLVVIVFRAAMVVVL